MTVEELDIRLKVLEDRLAAMDAERLRMNEMLTEQTAKSAPEPPFVEPEKPPWPPVGVL